MTRAERLQRFMLSLTQGPNVGIVQCSKKLSEELALLFPGYDRGIKLQSCCAGKFEFWWLAGTNNEEGFSIVVQVHTMNPYAGAKLESAESMVMMGAEPEMMWRAIADRMEEQEPFFEQMHKKCIGGLGSARSLAFGEVCDQPTDSTEKILDTLAHLVPGSIIRINWLLFGSGQGWQDLGKAKVAATQLEYLANTGVVAIADESSQATLSMIHRQGALDFQHSFTKVVLNDGFDPQIFIEQVAPGIKSISIA